MHTRSIKNAATFGTGDPPLPEDFPDADGYDMLGNAFLSQRDRHLRLKTANGRAICHSVPAPDGRSDGPLRPRLPVPSGTDDRAPSAAAIFRGDARLKIDPPQPIEEHAK